MDTHAYDHHDDQKINEDFINLVSKLLNNLPEFCRQVVPQYFKYKLGIIETFNELAKIVGSPSGTVSAQLTRCLRRLAEAPELIEYYKEN
jgi:DNA-directed RNA polymerase specialized sigma24 family protein